MTLQLLRSESVAEAGERADLIMSFRCEKNDEAAYPLGGQIGEGELGELVMKIVGEEQQKQSQGIAIAATARA